QVEQSGDYTAVVYDNRSLAESLPGTLAVLVRPTVVRHPQGITVAAGSNVTLTAGVYGGWPMTNRWRRGAFNIQTNIITAKQTNTLFLLPNIQTNQAAGYQVGVLNTGGSSQISSNGYVTVVVPPTNTSVMSGTDARFFVQAFGATRIFYQWKAGNTDIPGATNTTLLLSNVQSSSAGSYSVVVSAITNATIAPATFSATLTVQGSPPVLSQPQMLPSGGFQFVLTGESNAIYSVQFSPDLGSWDTLTNVSYTSGPVTVTDAPSASEPRRFYRALRP
ncbi:MAG TPA: immunoglobulin domain-containing protein, partial [Candidatus Binatia bacterium]|nr:immunoglobulin domain-containing protein [Candidatus Binatia bacterium]